jgi:hypothetical protein
VPRRWQNSLECGAQGDGGFVISGLMCNPIAS